MGENKKDIKGFAVGLILTLAIIAVISGLIFVSISIMKKPSDIANHEEPPTVQPPAPKKVVNEVEKSETKMSNPQASDKIAIVPTLLDEVFTNSAWCGTFQLVWNDMQNEVVKKDIEFDPQILIAENLNKQSFTENDISESYYYKTWGLKTLSLKEKIENEIKEKFNQTSDVLDKLDWTDIPEDESAYNGDSKEYLFYTMLYKEFNFENPFSILDKASFTGTNEVYNDAKYFGIDEDTDSNVYSQINVLYYNADDDFAVMLNTKEGDRVLLAKGDNGNTFKGIYDNVLAKTQNYEGNRNFTADDTFKVPNIKFNILKDFEEIENKPFYSAEGNECEIIKALQTIQFELDNKGGKIKSEAVIDMMETSAIADPEPIEHRYFNFDSTFTMFLIEDGKKLPYFAANIDDISLYQ